MEQQVALNKIYRAVHDGVCPNCGADLTHNEHEYVCSRCQFLVTKDEMILMRPAVASWGTDAVKTFLNWRTNGKDKS